VSLCKASKQLQDRCLGLPDQQLQLIVQQALQQKPKKLSPAQKLCADPDSCCTSLAWLVGTLSKRWGIMQLAARLDLQQALLSAEQDSLACYFLIRAGARITRVLIRASDCIMGLSAWADAYKQLRLSYPPLPYQLMQALQSEARTYTCLTHKQLQGVDNELLYDLAGAALKTSNKSLNDMLIRVVGDRDRLGWSGEMVFQLMVLSIKQDGDFGFERLFELPVAQEITAQQYNDLLVLLSKHLDGAWRGTATLIIQHVQWDEQLTGRIAAAIESQASSKRACIYNCRVCQFLQHVCSCSAATLPMQLQTSLLCAATSSHKDAACTLLRHMAKYEGMTEAVVGYNAVAAAIQSWPIMQPTKYRRYFKRLLQQPAVQQLPLEEVELLLQQAAGSGCAEGLRCLLKALPAAQEVTAEGYQQLLDLAVGSRIYRGWGRRSNNEEVLAVLVRCNLSARVPPGPGELQQLLVKCIEQDRSGVVKCLLGGFKEAAQQLSPAVVYGLLLQAACSAGGCLLVLLKLVPQIEEVPLEVLQQLLPVLMKRSCHMVKLTPSSVHDRSIYEYDHSRCSVCSLLKAAAGKLAAADVWEVLVAAARAPVGKIHSGGLAHLPGVDDLGDDQVEQLLLAAIDSDCEAGVWYRYGLELRLEQLQGELFSGRRLPSAVVHRLMVACVERAGYWRVGELKEELGLPTEGWEGPLSQEQLEQLLQIAVACSLGSAQGERRVESTECHSCLLLMAKLLPSLKERQQVVDMLWAAGVQMVAKKKSPDSQEHELTSNREAVLDRGLESDLRADPSSSSDDSSSSSDGSSSSSDDSSSSSDSDADADSDSDSGAW
jgi:hypothetical protein